MKNLKFILFFIFLCSLSFPQESPNYKNNEYAFNNGSNPAPEIVSTNFKITLSSIGDGIFPPWALSSNYYISSGFTVSYPPPSEVLNLRFTSKTEMIWDPEWSVGTYNVYRGITYDLPSGDYGNCVAYNLTSTSYSDTEIPISGHCFFYIITAVNKIKEEGTMGYKSDGTKRNNFRPCP